MRIAVISDTHGLLRPMVLEALQGAPVILHAGDVGKPDVLDALQALAPVHAIRGNVDRGEWAARLPPSQQVEIAGRRIFLIHDRHDLAIEPGPDGAALDIIVSGHSHRPSHELRDGITWLNPGSIGPRRFSLPISMAWLTLGATDQPPLVEFVRFEP